MGAFPGNGDGAYDGDLLYGGVGDDFVDGDAGNDTVEGGTGNDTLRGGGSDDVLRGDDGTDILYGDAGADTLFGGDDDDTLYGGKGNDSLDGDTGSDTVVFTGPVTDYSFDLAPGGALIVTDNVTGRDETDTLSGVEFANFDGVTFRLLQGDDGSNTTLQGPDDGTPTIIIAHDGADWGGGHATSDVIFGGAGADTLDGGDGDDTLLGEDGHDLLRGDGGNDQAFGGEGADILSGQGGDDSLSGDAGADLIVGGDGTDLIFGGADDDTLFGGADSDTLTGGTGKDTFGLTQFGGVDTVTIFDMTLDAGRTADQLDVSDLRTPGGDPIIWRDVVVSDTVGDGSGDAVLTFPGGERVVLQGVSPEQVDSKQSMASMGIPCFAAGTRLLTPTAWKQVETLRPGDVVLTSDGPQPVIWAGQRLLDVVDLTLRPDLKPIHFPVAAIGNSVALRLSPQHGVLMTDASGAKVLVRAKHLAEIAFGGARVAKGVRSVSYHHILLKKHAILCAEGAPTESFYPGPAAMAMLQCPARLAVIEAIAGSSGQITYGKPGAAGQHYSERVHSLVGREATSGCSPARFDTLEHIGMR